LSIDCLLIIENDSPLNFALDMLLVPSSEINAVKSNAVDLQGIVDEISNLKSQVVILEDSATPTRKNSLANLLMSNPELKIIVVLKDSNYVHIFRKDEILIENASEFLEIIQSKQQSNIKENAST
jgi:hypothetical protein